MTHLKEIKRILHFHMLLKLLHSKVFISYNLQNSAFFNAPMATQDKNRIEMQWEPIICDCEILLKERALVYATQLYSEHFLKRLDWPRSVSSGPIKRGARSVLRKF